MTRIFYDTEFLEDGRTVDLISIGMAADDGREYYAVNADMPVHRVLAHEWLRRQVWPQLPRVELSDGARGEWYELDRNDETVRPRGRIADEVQDFILASGPGVELWADYAAYDHVVLCQLFGTMADLPPGVPMWTHDFQQAWENAGKPDLPEQASGLHHALADARHLKHQFDVLGVGHALRGDIEQIRRAACALLDAMNTEDHFSDPAGCDERTERAMRRLSRLVR